MYLVAMLATWGGLGFTFRAEVRLHTRGNVDYTVVLWHCTLSRQTEGRERR
jgi:hypothetical protein